MTPVVHAVRTPRRSRLAATAWALAAGGALLAVAAVRRALPPARADAPLPPLVVRLTSPLAGQTLERVVKVEGEVSGGRPALVTLALNGVAMPVACANGRFALSQVLAPGFNSIRAVAEDGGRVAQDLVTVHAQVPAKDLRVTLSWDTPGTDVDLWVTGPDGERVMYNHRQGKAGGTLDTDVTTGYGPETYTQARTLAGAYRVEANYYGGGAPTRVRVTTVLHEGTPEEERREFEGLLWRANDTSIVGEFQAR